MIRNLVVADLRHLAVSLGLRAHGSEWHLFGSVDRDEMTAADVDLMILCQSHHQADILRRALVLEVVGLPIHLALMTFDEANEIQAAQIQRSHAIFP